MIEALDCISKLWALIDNTFTSICLSIPVPEEQRQRCCHNSNERSTAERKVSADIVNYRMNRNEMRYKLRLTGLTLSKQSSQVGSVESLGF